MRIALIGGTGLIGRLLLPRLLARGDRVETFQRRSSARSDPGLHEHVAPAGEWPARVAAAAPEAAVSTLGTTMRRAGSKAAFRAVDLDMVVAFAAAARAAGARRMVAVSSVGADPAAANFYLRLKGEMEAALAGLGFERLDLFRPGLLRGPRGGDRRLGERVAILLSPLANLALRGPLDRYAAIDADRVAAAIAACLEEEERGIFRHENAGIRRLAAGKREAPFTSEGLFR